MDAEGGRGGKSGLSGFLLRVAVILIAGLLALAIDRLVPLQVFLDLYAVLRAEVRETGSHAEVPAVTWFRLAAHHYRFAVDGPLLCIVATEGWKYETQG